MSTSGLGQKLTHASNAIWAGRIALAVFGARRVVEEIDIMHHGGEADFTLVVLFAALSICGAFMSPLRMWTAYCASALLAASLTIFVLKFGFEFPVLNIVTLCVGIAGLVAVFKKRHLLDEREALREISDEPKA